MKKKYMKLSISLVGIVVLIILIYLGIKFLNKKEINSNNLDEMISYTLDGEILTDKLKKSKGYIANKVICESGTNIVFDNTNWEIEVIDVDKKDKCVVDFTKNESTEGYRVSAIGNVDSKSKATINGGVVRFYPKEGYSITEVSGCNGEVKNGYVEIPNVTSNQTCNISTRISLLKDRILADNPVVLERKDFTSVLDEDTPSSNIIYKANGTYTEDGNTVYYFAGNVSNNWVKFGRDENNKSLYWRIVRTNENGGIRLLYAGTSPDTTEGYLIINDENYYQYADYRGYGDVLYVGYMYGTAGSKENIRTNENSSIVKNIIDAWYSKGLNTKKDLDGNRFSKYVSKNAIYCNDRSGGYNYNSNRISFAASQRLNYVNTHPSYRCGYNKEEGYYGEDDEWISTPNGLYNDASDADKFSASTSNGGNGELKYPVALITADEIAMAGGHTSYKNQNAYFYVNSKGEKISGHSDWWTMTPYFYNHNEFEHMLIVSDGLNYDTTTSTNAIRPVLSLKSCVTYKSGNGTSYKPYEVSIDTTCASAEN